MKHLNTNYQFFYYNTILKKAIMDNLNIPSKLGLLIFKIPNMPIKTKHTKISFKLPY